MKKPLKALLILLTIVGSGIASISVRAEPGGDSKSLILAQAESLNSLVARLKNQAPKSMTQIESAAYFNEVQLIATQAQKLSAISNANEISKPSISQIEDMLVDIYVRMETEKPLSLSHLTAQDQIDGMTYESQIGEIMDSVSMLSSIAF